MSSLKELFTLFRGKKGWNMIKLFPKKRRSRSWIVLLLSGLGAALMALQFNRKGIRDKKRTNPSAGQAVERSRKPQARRMDYRWAMEMAEDFLKKTQASNKQNP